MELVNHFDTAIMRVNVDEGKIEIDIIDANNELNDGDERIDKTANEVVTA